MIEFVAPSARDTPEPVPQALSAGEAVALSTADAIWTAATNSPRTQQPEVGPSELGLACSRQIAYRLAGTTPVNMTVDPLPSIAGTAMHSWLSDVYRRTPPPGRWLVDHRIEYLGVRGTLDLYDRRWRRVIDWKFPKKAKARRMRTDGPPQHYRWQVQVYAAGLAAAGETPEECAIVFVPIDGTLDDVFAWAFPFDPVEAADAVDRLVTVRRQLADAKGSPGEVKAQPSRLCPWCPYHRPKWNGDLAMACPGEDRPQ